MVSDGCFVLALRDILLLFLREAQVETIANDITAPLVTRLITGRGHKEAK